MAERRRRRLRDLTKQWAREAIVESNGDRDQFEAKFKAKAQEFGIDPATILTLLLFAIKLWQLWKDKGELSMSLGDLEMSLGEDDMIFHGFDAGEDDE